GVTATDLSAENFDGFDPDGSPLPGQTIIGTTGNDTLDGTSGADEIYGREGNDTIRGQAGNDRIFGEDGNDNLEGGLGDDYVDGGAGRDLLGYRYSTSSGDDTLLGGSGDDHIYVSINSAIAAPSITINAGADNDLLTLENYHASAVVIADMGSGDDEIGFYGGRAGAVFSVDLGSGDDFIRFGSGGVAGLGDFALTLGAGRDVIELQALPENLSVSDFEVGASGDVIRLNIASTLTNWDGSDNPFATGHFRLVQQGADTVVQVDTDGGGDSWATLLTLDGVTATDLSAENFDGFDPDEAPFPITVNGTPSNDTLTGTNGSDVINGLDGNDTLNGLGGNDTLNGDGGNDTLDGGVGDDLLNGGTGNDTLIGGLGDDVSNGGDGDDLFTYSGSSGGGADTMNGGAGNDRFEVTNPDAPGGSAFLTFSGGAGDDLLEILANRITGFSFDAGNGNDRAYVRAAFASTITLDMGAGDDLIEIGRWRGFIGGVGGDVALTLGDGQDTVVFADQPTSTTITDFQTGASGDILVLADFLGATLSSWDGGNPFASGHLQIVQIGSDVILQIDTNGGADGWSDLLTFQNTTVATFTTDNFDGYNPAAVSTSEEVSFDQELSRLSPLTIADLRSGHDSDMMLRWVDLWGEGTLSAPNIDGDRPMGSAKSVPVMDALDPSEMIPQTGFEPADLGRLGASPVGVPPEGFLILDDLVGGIPLPIGGEGQSRSPDLHAWTTSFDDVADAGHDLFVAQQTVALPADIRTDQLDGWRLLGEPTDPVSCDTAPVMNPLDPTRLLVDSLDFAGADPAESGILHEPTVIDDASGWM
ncbi:calcium-binding protein, partial [Maricaulis sp.]|uniref:calcium-binding protein n=1 Tax=Maricaulis sp. TaxID=1486257 RepID=UPI00260A7C54